MSNLLLIIIGTVLVNNFVLVQFLGICPFLGVSKKVETAIGMGFAVIFVITLAAPITWLVYYYLLAPLNIMYLQTVVFILVIASLVQLVEMIIQKISPVLYHALGIFLPLITTNCAVLGVALLTQSKNYDLLQGLVFAIANAIGFALAMILFAGLREHLNLMQVPKGMRGVPIALVTAGILAMAFMGFAGMV